MEKKTSYAEFSSQLNDKNRVILEFGRHYTRCGFAGEFAPRAIIKSSVTDTSGKQVYLHDISDPIDLETKLGDFIEKIYFNYLAVSPKEKKVVIVESVFCKSLFRNTLTRVFFDQFTVPAILFVPDHLMALATLGNPTGLVLDIGSQEAIAIAVVNGVTLLDGAQFASLGARTIDSLISTELAKSNPNFSGRIEPETIEDIRIKACFVAPFERGTKMTIDKLKKSRDIQLEAIRLAKQQGKEISIGTMEDCYFLSDQDEFSPATLEYSLMGQRSLCIPGSLREGACEIFFEIFGHEHSLTTMIVETVLLAPIDCRRSLAENILIIGGLATLPGLTHRLSEELINVDKYDRFKGKIPEKFKFHQPICPTNYVAWLGASMFCTTSSMELRSTTRDQWLREGKKNFRDWSLFFNNEF